MRSAGSLSASIFATSSSRDLAAQERIAGRAALDRTHRLRHRAALVGVALVERAADAGGERVGIGDEAAGDHQRVAADAHREDGAVAIDDVAARAGDGFAVFLLARGARHQVFVAENLEIEETSFEAGHPDAEDDREHAETAAEQRRPVDGGRSGGVTSASAERLLNDPRVVQVANVDRRVPG